MKTFLTFLVWTIAIVLGAVTNVANFRYGLLIGAGEERWIYAVGGSFLDLAKTFLPTLMAIFLPERPTKGTFRRRVAGWSIFALGVVWSMTCAMGLYAITKNARIGETAGDQKLYEQLMAEKPKKEGRVAELTKTKARETIEGEIAAKQRDKLWDRTNQCTNATAEASRIYCSEIDTLKASLITAPTAETLKTDIERARNELTAIETSLAGIKLDKVMQKVDPAGEALAKLLGVEDVEKVKSWLAFLLGVMFESGPLLPWIILGQHAPTIRRQEQISEEVKPEAKPEPPPKVSTPEPKPEPKPSTEPPLIELREEDSIVAIWAKQALIRRKGSYVPAADIRAAFEAWCRLNGHDVTPWNPTTFGKEMTRLGFERVKRSGGMRYLDIALIPAARNLKVVASNERIA